MEEKETRKIFNYKSIIMIDKTIEEEGYHPDKWGKTSSKFIWAICRYCGEPHRIRKGFYNKSESACHKECKLREQGSFCPFLQKKYKEKAKKTNAKRYGHEFASSSEEIKNKISKTKKTKEYRKKVIKTVQDRYGVDNVFQNEDVKEKTKSTNIEKYGVDNPMKSEEIKDRAKETNLKKYGVKNIAHVDIFEESRKDSFNKTISVNKNGNYDLINILRGEKFWDNLKNDSLKNISELYGVSYQSLASSLSNKEFREKYYSTYSFPRQQKQREVFDFIKDLGVEVSMNNRKIISPLELDIFIPNHNLAIEFNGSYWHSEAVLESKVARNKHLIKTKLCKEKGIRLIHIFEKDWESRTDQYKFFIRCILGFNDKKYNARSCSITDDICLDYIDKSHVQGSPKHCLKSFCLVDDSDGIVGSITANRHHRQGFSNDIILSRLCFSPNSTVRGGSSRLFSCFKKWAKEENYERIISWSDNSYTEGNIYKVLGFNLEKEYGPDYFYWDMKNNIYASKQSQQKKQVKCPENMTEREWCTERGLHRIWDCGKKRWIFNIV